MKEQIARGASRKGSTPRNNRPLTNSAQDEIAALLERMAGKRAPLAQEGRRSRPKLGTDTPTGRLRPATAQLPESERSRPKERSRRALQDSTLSGC